MPRWRTRIGNNSPSPLQESIYLAADVSDARAVFRIEGERAADVLRKLSPVDFDKLAPGELAPQPRSPGRRSDMAGRSAALRLSASARWRDTCWGLLSHSAQPGSELN